MIAEPKKRCQTAFVVLGDETLDSEPFFVDESGFARII
jgi:hypothetical protein